MIDKKRIVVLGGGYAGVNSVKILYKKLKKNKNIELVLIDKNPFHTLMTELHEVAGGRAEPDSVRISYNKIFGGKKIDVIIDNIKTIDFINKNLISTSGEYHYDYLIIGAGAEPDYLNVNGIRENGFTLWSYDDAIELREHIESIFLQASREIDHLKRKELLTFVVAGGGFTGVEFTGELLEWKNTLSRKYGINEKEVSVYLIEALDRILSILPDSLSYKALMYFHKKGCEVLLNSQILKANNGEVFIKGGRSFKTKTLVWTCGVQGCEFGANLGLSKGVCVTRSCNYDFGISDEQSKLDKFSEGGEYVSGKLGRIMVHDTMQSIEYQNVFIAGDLLWYEEDGHVLPQVVETALQTSETAANNIINDINGKEKKSFKSDYHGFMVSIGSKYGVAALMNIKISGFMAIVLKHLINLHYLLGVAGLNTIWDYLRHHFLDIKDNRSIIGGHAAARIRIYWVLILRLFLGTMWLIEGASKISSGWLDPGHIYIISTSAVTGASIVQSKDDKISEDTKKKNDASSGASVIVSNSQDKTKPESSAVTSASTNVAESNEKSLTDAVSSASAPSSSAQVPLIKKPLGIYIWIENILISRAPYVFQASVVIAEILIGLALIGGLFTFVASIGSIGLCLMFLISALAGKEILWYMASSIMMLGGAGRGFGLDYWVIPWIKKWWNGTKIAKKTYLYIDEPKNK